MQNKEIGKLKKKLDFDKGCHVSGYITGDKDETISIKEIENILQYIDQLENKVKELEATKDKYLQKLVYALTPTTHELSTNNNNAFKQIVTDNIDLETCKIKRKLKEFWGIDKY